MLSLSSRWLARETHAVPHMCSHHSGFQLGKERHRSSPIRKNTSKQASQSLPGAVALQPTIWLEMNEIAPSRVPSWKESLKTVPIISLQKKKRPSRGHSKIVFAEASVLVTAPLKQICSALVSGETDQRVFACRTVHFHREMPGVFANTKWEMIRVGWGGLVSMSCQCWSNGLLVAASGQAEVTGGTLMKLITNISCLARRWLTGQRHISTGSPRNWEAPFRTGGTAIQHAACISMTFFHRGEAGLAKPGMHILKREEWLLLIRDNFKTRQQNAGGILSFHLLVS